MFGLFKREPEPPAKDLTAAQRWALTAAALPALHFGASVDRLGGYAPTEKQAKGIRTTLKYNWSVNSREELLTTLDWLMTEGHRLQFAQTTGQSADTYLGWDLGRYIFVTGFGYVAGYVSEDEVWEKIMPAAKMLQAKFTNWQTLNDSYLAGRQLWNEDPEGLEDMKKILTKEYNSPISNFATVAWNTNL